MKKVVMSKCSQQGFSLIELIVVIVILAIMISFAAPAFQSMIEKVKTESAQSDLVAMLKEAKRIARSNATTARVELKNSASSASQINLTTDSGVNKTEDLFGDIAFENEYTITFNAIGTVTPPNGDPMYRLAVVNANTGLKRYIDVTASGQIVSHFANFAP